MSTADTAFLESFWQSLLAEYDDVMAKLEQAEQEYPTCTSETVKPSDSSAPNAIESSPRSTPSSERTSPHASH